MSLAQRHNSGKVFITQEREKRQLAPVHWRKYIDREEKKAPGHNLGGTPTFRGQAEEEKLKKPVRQEGAKPGVQCHKSQQREGFKKEGAVNRFNSAENSGKVQTDI